MTHQTIGHEGRRLGLCGDTLLRFPSGTALLPSCGAGLTTFSQQLLLALPSRHFGPTRELLRGGQQSVPHWLGWVGLPGSLTSPSIQP